MLKEIIRNLMQRGNKAVFDPQQYNDDVALKTSWKPLKKGGANFRTHKLAAVSPNRYEFKLTVGSILFYAIFSLIGVGLIGFGTWLASETDFQLETANYALLGMGVVFLAVGISFAWSGSKPIVFDTMSGYFWKGKQSPDHTIEYTNPELFTPLNDIHALQIVSEYIRGNKSSYYSYELNLVFRDGSRKNVVDHGNLKALRLDATVLSRIIHKPIWDMTMREDSGGSLSDLIRNIPGTSGQNE